MRAEAIHAFALIGLRALAEYDPTEYNRITDLSKRRLEEHIAELLADIQEEPEIDELQRQMYQFRSVERESESQVASAFLLRQISRACLLRAQALAMAYHHEAESSVREGDQAGRSNTQTAIDRGFSTHEEYLRLGIMRLLRGLHEYDASFHYRWRNSEIDCVLQPHNDEQPTILIEFKPILESVQQAREVLRQLRRSSAGWDKSALLVILTLGPSQELLGTLDAPSRKLDGRAFVLIYDVERDEFSYESAGGLIRATKQRRPRGR